MTLADLTPGKQVHTKAGSITVVAEAGRDSHHHLRFSCVCVCGNIFVSLGSMILAGRVHSCGCFRKKIAPGNSTKFDYGVSAENAMYSSYVYSAKERGHRFDLERVEFSMLIKQDCFYCGAPPELKFNKKKLRSGLLANGVDRLNNEIGYTLENCVPCCTQCNRAKHKQRALDFVSWAEAVAARKNAVMQRIR